MASPRDGWAPRPTEPIAAQGRWTRLAFPLITAVLVLLLGAAVFGLASF